MAAFPSSWSEHAIISILKAGGTVYEYGAIVETIDISEPTYPWESIPNIAGGRIEKQGPQEDGEITVEFYPTDETVADNGGLAQEFVGGTVDSSQPVRTDTSWTAGTGKRRDTFLVAVMWTDDGAVAAATAATAAADKTASRFYAKLARITDMKTSFTDGILKRTVTFKFPPFNKAGDTMPWAWESTNDTDTSPLPALTYTAETDL